MQHITGISRYQMRIFSLEDAISPDNQVRFIDAFVNIIDLSKLGFELRTLKSEGRPSYKSQVFLKLYLYGYLGGIRSSRKLEKECFKNIEMQWLLEAVRPNYHSMYLKFLLFNISPFFSICNVSFMFLSPVRVLIR
mgnify:FL=1